MDKSKIINQLVSTLKTEVRLAEESYQTTRSLSQEDDFKSEGKYDTRAIEAGQLAEAQLKRLKELKLELNSMENLDQLDGLDNERVSIGNLVVIDDGEKEQIYFIGPSSGGRNLEIENQKVSVVSFKSPIGSSMIGLSEGDSFELETAFNEKEYLIISIN